MQKIREYKIELQTLEPFRIGGVEDPLSGIHNPVTRVGDRLTIPGSSLKGVLRAEIEQFLIDTHWNKATKEWPSDKIDLQPCIPATRYTSDEELLIKEGKYRSVTCHYPCFKRPCPLKRDQNAHSICPVCYFMGAMGLNGFLRVPFLFSDISATELYSARMGRGVKTVVEGTNRPYQLVPDGAKFTGKLQIIVEDTVLGWEFGKPRPLSENETLGDRWLKTNAMTMDELINTYILQRLETIKLLGGYKSKGFGQVKVTVTEENKG